MVAALDINNAQACSSVEEHYLDTVGVGGSIPPMPTKLSSKNGARLAARCYPAQPLSSPNSIELEGRAKNRLLEFFFRPSRLERINRE
jgi:hypothetical protein